MILIVTYFSYLCGKLRDKQQRGQLLTLGIFITCVINLWWDTSVREVKTVRNSSWIPYGILRGDDFTFSYCTLVPTEVLHHVSDEGT